MVALADKNSAWPGMKGAPGGGDDLALGLGVGCAAGRSGSAWKGGGFGAASGFGGEAVASGGGGGVALPRASTVIASARPVAASNSAARSGPSKLSRAARGDASELSTLVARACASMACRPELTLVVIFLLLYLNFGTLTETLIVMLSLPFALVGGLWLMWWLGFNMSVAVAVGFIALAGVAAETGVVMLIYLDQRCVR